MNHARPTDPAALCASADSDRKLDQFYTRDPVAAECYSILLDYLGDREVQFVEPSAGTGAFFKLLPPGSLAYDIDPKYPGIVEADFLQTEIRRTGEIAIIGNPPFGKNSSLAVKFFNHAASQAAIIALILPRTFQKNSIHKRLNPFFHCVDEKVIPDGAFTFQGKRKSVPVVFQIWERRSKARVQHTLPTRHADFEYTTPDEADFGVKRVGHRAGCVHWNFNASPQSHYFIRARVKGVEAIMRSLDFEAVARRTAGNPSLARTELVELYAERKAGSKPKNCAIAAVGGQREFDF